MSIHKVRATLENVIALEFGCCRLVWMFFSKKLNSLINRPHEKAFRTVYQDHDASFTKLLEKNISTGMHNRIIQLFAIGLFKAKSEL